MANANIEENNLKIAQSFNREYYELWENYVLVKNAGNEVQSPMRETLALLCILAHNWRSLESDVTYEKRFFDLFCEALGSSDIAYRGTPPSKTRPRLFKHPPDAVVSRNFCFVWPVSFTIAEEHAEKFYLGVPSQYLHADEETDGALSTLLYLLMCDTVASFRKALESDQQMDQVELPCLLGYFFSSEENNRRNIPALIGEYLAFLNLSFELQYHEAWTYATEEVTNDFRVFAGADNRCFSVKTCNEGSCLRFFATDVPDPSARASADPSARASHQKTDDVLLILNCDCSHCKRNPTVTLAEADLLPADYRENCTRVRAEVFIDRLFGGHDRGSHYILSVSNYFDLRFAISSFRTPEQRAARINLRWDFFDYFQRMIESGNPDDKGQACLCWNREQ